MTPFPPLSPNGSRSFPSKNLSKGVGEWNHYYVRCINGEVRLWVNGEEVSGGTGCEPRTRLSLPGVGGLAGRVPADPDPGAALMAARCLEGAESGTLRTLADLSDADREVLGSRLSEVPNGTGSRRSGRSASASTRRSAPGVGQP